MILRLIAQTLAFGAVLALLLFWPAGTQHWAAGWSFVLIVTGGSLAVGLWLARVNPELLRERMRSPVRREQAGWDRILMSFAALSFAGWLALMGWEVGRYGGRVVLAGQVLGAALVAACFVGAAWVFRENSFATPVVDHQSARGQVVATTGPYAVVRHPMYASALLFFLGAPLLLGSLWGLLFAPVMLPLLTARAVGEERLLARQLPGYAQYMMRVRARFLPRIW